MVMPVVLVLDANERSRVKAASVLQMGGYDTIEAATLDEGLSLLMRSDVDLLLVSLESWGCERIDPDWSAKAARLHPDLRVLCIGCRPDIEKHAGVRVDTLETPYTIASLNGAVRKLLGDLRTGRRSRNSSEPSVLHPKFRAEEITGSK